MGRKIECTFPIELEVEVKATLSKYYPATRHSPEEPSCIEDLEMYLEGIPIPQNILDKIMEKYNDEVSEQVIDALLDEWWYKGV